MQPVAITFTGPRTVGFRKETHRALERNEARLRTLFSGISTGTELTAFRGTNLYLHTRWDQHTRMFLDDPAHGSLDYPVVGWGYEEVGEVIEAGADAADMPLGSVVYGTWGRGA